MSATDKISIVIPYLESARGLRLVKELIVSCKNQSVRAEIIVVSNFPCEELEEFCIERGVFFLCTNTRGVNTARNFGAAKSSAELLYFLDDDCLLFDEEHLQKTINFFKENTTADCAGGLYLSSKDSTANMRGYNEMSNSWIRITTIHGGADTAIVRRLLGGNFCIRRKIFGAGFDERIVSGGDEAEFFKKNMKMKIFLNKNLNVIHRPDGKIKTIFSRAANQSRGWISDNESTPLKLKFIFFLKMLKKCPMGVFFYITHFSVFFLIRLISPQSSPRA